MTDEDRIIQEAAIAWLARVTDQGFTAWTDWSAWMAADPRHEAAYWRLAAADADFFAAARGAPIVAFETAPPHPLRRRAVFAIAAIAACVVIAVGAGFWSSNDGGIWTVTTAPGDRRTVELAGGRGRAHLNGGTAVTFSRSRPQEIRLDAGEILIEAEGDGLRLLVGEARIEDIGTVFDVARTAQGVRVSVSEGRVRYANGGQVADLVAGERLEATNGRLRRSAIPTDAVGAWRDGRLDWRQASLSQVAEDLTRTLGVKVTVAPGGSAPPFTGTFRLRGDAESQRDRLETLLGVEVTAGPDGWVLGPGTTTRS